MVRGKGSSINNLCKNNHKEAFKLNRSNTNNESNPGSYNNSPTRNKSNLNIPILNTIDRK